MAVMRFCRKAGLKYFDLFCINYYHAHQMPEANSNMSLKKDLEIKASWEKTGIGMSISFMIFSSLLLKVLREHNPLIFLSMY
jgi:hypothetical protein